LLAKYHPTLSAEIAGWGSTVEAGPKPYRHAPVKIVPPGNVESVSRNISIALPPHHNIFRQEKIPKP